jgi:hypothetical protein
MKHELRSWIYLVMAVVVLIAAMVTGRNDLTTDALILLAISAIYSTRAKP